MQQEGSEVAAAQLIGRTVGCVSFLNAFGCGNFHPIVSKSSTLF